MALAKTIKEALWLKGLMEDFGINQTIVKIFCNNQSVVHFPKNSQYHSRTNHIDIKYHFVRDKIEKGEIEVLKVHTSHNAADMLTKLVAKLKLLKCLELIGLDLLEKG